jgi:ribose transport system permease protein
MTATIPDRDVLDTDPPRRNSRILTDNRSLIIGGSMLLACLVLGAATVDGFISVVNFRSMLLLGAFLGLASVGQTLCALLGALDLSIPFVIGASNIGSIWLMTKGVPPVAAVAIILAVGALVGLLNGVLSLRLQNQALIVTLGTGFAVVGGTQIITSIGSQYGGNVAGEVPEWLRNLASLNGETFGLGIPPVIILWLLLAAGVVLLMRSTWFGRSLYALGGNRSAARLALISEPRRWIAAYVISGFFAALTGLVLLGFSGGGFAGVGDPYLFLTVAAVAVGGTSLLGGRGGYGSTVLGVLVLTVLTSLLVGWGLDNNAQQVVLGLLIVPIVGIYARAPHVRYRV